MGCCKSSTLAFEPDYDAKHQGPPTVLTTVDICDPPTTNGASSSFSVAEFVSEPEFKKEPSGESFHTCISQESRLVRLQALAPPHPGPKETRTPSTVIKNSPMSTIASSLSGRGTEGVVQNDALDSTTTKDVRFAAGTKHDDGTAIPQLPDHLPVSATASSASPSVSPRRSQRSSVFKRSGSISAFTGRLSRRLSASKDSTGSPEGSRSLEMRPRMSRRPSFFIKKRAAVVGMNKNMPFDYVWLEELLEMIVKNEAYSKGSLDRSAADAQSSSPLFVVCGACPSGWAPMQAILYSAVSDKTNVVDFWWVKPVKGQPESLERQTLDRNGKGPHKNDPGKSKAIYKPLGDLFAGTASGKVKQEFGFGMEFVKPSGDGTAAAQRAFIEDSRKDPPCKYYLYFVWQEEWTSNPFSSNQFIKGKIAYQRQPQRGVEDPIFLREYCITNGKMELAEEEEPSEGELLFNDRLKILTSLKGSK